MGKSPGKWIRTILFGKKSSKYNTSKGREKVAYDVSAAAKASETDVAFDPPVASHPTSNAMDRNEGKLKLENNGAANSSDDVGILLPRNKDADSQRSAPRNEPDDHEKIRREEAATLAQAAFRGYLARRAFRALKGIIRLQALIRGHLVRRQAVATLCCVLQLVKLQAHVRGRKVRHSDIGVEVHKKCSLVKPLEGKLVDSVRVSTSIQMAKLSANAFVFKLLATSPTVMPLHLNYDSGEPNSVSNWLERWSASNVWKPVPQPKKIPDAKSQRKQGNNKLVEAETGRPKRSVRRVPAANIDSISVQATSELEKPKRNLRKVLSHPVEPLQENPQNEFEKVKRNLRKVHNPVVENSVQSEVEIEKPKQSLEKISNTSVHDVLEQIGSNSVEKMNGTLLTVSKLPDVEPTPDSLAMNETFNGSHGDQVTVESKPLIESNGKDENIPITNGELSLKEDSTNKENQKSSRKASIPAKQERLDNGLQSSPTLPSYMAATESARAKLRAQGSPRFGQDGAEKNNPTRRHSLPSPINSKISSQSPRTQRLVHAGGKGGNKTDKALLSSRDGNAKVNQAEWRR